MKFLILALTGLTSLAAASPVVPSRTQHIHLQGRQANGTISAPCAKVSDYIYGDGTAEYHLKVPAQLAWDCINDTNKLHISSAGDDDTSGLDTSNTHKNQYLIALMRVRIPMSGHVAPSRK